MENTTRDYYAPFGMSTFDFNSLIRRRNLDELTYRLLEEGRVHHPSASAGNGLASVEEQAGPAQTPTTSASPTITNIAFGSPVPAVVHIDGQPRPASSVYSRDIDGNSYRSASTVQDVSIRSPGPRSLLPPLVSWQNSPESSSSSSVLINGPIDPDGMFPAAVEVSDGDYSITNPSASSPSWTNVASLVPVPLNVPMSGNCGGEFRRSPNSAEELPMTVEPTTPDRKSNNTSSASSVNATGSSPALDSQGTSKGSSSRTSLSSPAKSVSSSATSASNIGSPCEVSNEDSPPALASQGTSKGSSSRTSLSSPAKPVSSSATSASNIGTPCEVSNADSSPALESQGTSKGSSSRTSLSSPEDSVPSSATSASNIGTPCEVSTERLSWPRRIASSVKKSFRSSSTKSSSVTGSETSQDLENRGPTGYYYSRAEFLELQQRIRAQNIALRGLHPDYHHWWEWDSLCSKIVSLDFDVAEMVLVASDMTTCMQVPPAQFWGDRAHLKVDVDFLELAYEKHCQEYFRARLSRRVKRRIERLKEQARYGSVREMEDWYREVVGVIGWRDEAEACLPWSWRENGN
jgi:hypothetical protein